MNIPIDQFVADVRRCFTYDQESGRFERRRETVVGGPRPNYSKPCVKRRICKFLGKQFQIHRLIWVHVYGRLPNGLIDHINGDWNDNRLCNLREATPEQNNWNAGMFRHNTSGFKGVSFNRGRWTANIRKGGRQVNLGRFDTPEEAYAAYCNAGREHRGEFWREPL